MNPFHDCLLKKNNGLKRVQQILVMKQIIDCARAKPNTISNYIRHNKSSRQHGILLVNRLGLLVFTIRAHIYARTTKRAIENPVRTT